MEENILFYCMPSLFNNLKEYFQYLKTNNCNELKLTKKNHMPFCGFNTGNHMFIKSLYRMFNELYNITLFSYSWDSLQNKIDPIDPMCIEADSKIIYNLFPENSKLGDNKYKFIVFPCSNWLNSSFKIENYTTLQNLFYKNNIKCIFWGLGTQSSLNEKLIISSEINTFLNTGKLYKNIFIVRGNNTYDLVKKYIDKTHLLCSGCPSIFLNNDLELKKKIITKYENVKKSSSIKLGFHLSQKMKISNEFENKYLDLINNDGVICFPQTEQDIINHIYFDNNKTFLLEKNNKIYKFDKNNFKYFFDVHDEINFIHNNIDFVITTRIHGAIKTICAETPVILIYHDNRTYELGSILKIPLISEKEFIENDLYKIINNYFNFNNFEKNKLFLKNKIKNFFKNNDILIM
tara:strand:- start:4076 stop:5290 length:1215 start_codon:yes stop_codon:yes gene_type:complete